MRSAPTLAMAAFEGEVPIPKLSTPRSSIAGGPAPWAEMGGAVEPRTHATAPARGAGKVGNASLYLSWRDVFPPRGPCISHEPGRDRRTQKNRESDGCGDRSVGVFKKPVRRAPLGTAPGIAVATGQRGIQHGTAAHASTSTRSALKKDGELAVIDHLRRAQSGHDCRGFTGGPEGPSRSHQRQVVHLHLI